MVVGSQVCVRLCDLIHVVDYRTGLAPEYCTDSFCSVLPLKLTISRSSSPGIIVANTHSVGASLAVWIASGLLAWTGASSFAELGYVYDNSCDIPRSSIAHRSSIPLDGGAQAYLSYAYGPLVSYLFAWTAISALKPG